MGVKEILKNINPFSLREELSSVQKELNMLKAADRPWGGSYFNSDILYQGAGMPVEDLYLLAKNSDVLTGMHFALRREIFRGGVELLESDDLTSEATDSSEGELANPNERKAILERIKEINGNKQSVLDVLRELEDDFNIVDTAFMLLRFNYSIDGKGDILNKELVEILRIHPATITFVMNRYDEFGKDDGGNDLYFSLADRQRVFKNLDRHPVTGEQLYRAYYQQKTGDKMCYYAKWEIVHDTRYRPSKRFGFSPLLSAWFKIRTLQAEDKYMYEMYEGKRPPKGMLAFFTANSESLRSAWADMLERAKQAPHLPGIIAVPPAITGQGGKPAEFIDFMKSLNELQFTEQRNEFRNAIGFIYGVSPILMNDTSSGGGLNNEGLQYTVTNRAVECAQQQYNEKFLTAIMDAVGISGYVLRLRPSEEQDEMAKLQRLNQSLLNGEVALRLGLKARFDKKLGEVIIDDGELQKQEPQGFNNFGSGFYGNEETQGNEAEESSGKPQDIEVGKSEVPNVKKLYEFLKSEISKFLVKFKRKPTEKELQKQIQNINKNLIEQLKEGSSGIFEKEYKRAIQEVSKELSSNFQFEHTDKEAVKVLINQDVLHKAFAGISLKAAEGIRDIIDTAYRQPEGLTGREIEEKIKELAGVTDSRAETIARTEIGKVSAAARKNQYMKADPEGRFMYKHLGPDDHRTTPTCKRIIARTQKGVSMQEYIKVLEEESRKDFPDFSVSKEAPIAHYNCRHQMIRVR